MKPALATRGIELRLGTRVVLAGVDLEVRPGEVVGLVGRNGAGKTSLLRVASRVLRPQRGRVWVEGRPLEAFGRRELARALAVVPQESVIPFPFRVLEVVLMGRSPHHSGFGFESAEDVHRARAALERLGIAALAERSILELSGGERQLVLLARALAQQARLLLLDEPTAFLDLAHRLRVHRILRELAEAGGSALVVSHDLTLAARLCDRLALLHEGRVLAQGPAREVLTRDRLAEALGLEADLLEAPDGSWVVVPRAEWPPPDRASQRRSAQQVRGGC